MTARDYMLRLAQNNAWANETLGAACVALAPEAFTAPRPGFFPSLSGTLNHIYLVDLYYIDALEGAGLGRAVFARKDIRDAAELVAAQAAADARLIAFCTGLTEDGLAAPCITQRQDGPVKERVDWTLLHLFQHQVHHRGQAHAMLTHAGVEPPQLDDFFLTFGRVDSAKPYWSA